MVFFKNILKCGDVGLCCMSAASLLKGSFWNRVFVGCLVVVLACCLVGLVPMRSVSALPSEGLSVYPSYVEAGSSVEVSLDVALQLYDMYAAPAELDPSFIDRRDNEWENYRSRSCNIALVSTLGGAYDSSSNFVGSAYIDDTGYLYGDAVIPSSVYDGSYYLVVSYEDADMAGAYNWYASISVWGGVSGSGDDGSPGSSSDFDDTGDSSSPCIIATATYGGPLESEVCNMRHVRDDLIGSSDLGGVLISGWNDFYYSWSPSVASAISEKDALRAASSALLYPLCGVVRLAGWEFEAAGVFGDSAASALSFGLAAVLSSVVYVLTPVSLAMVIIGFKNKEKFEK